MVIVGWLAVAFAAWMLDSAIRNRAPVATLKEIVQTGQLPVIGKSYPAPSHAGSAPTPVTGAAPASFATGGTGAPVSGNVTTWLAQANAILAQNGTVVTDVGAQQIIIQHESGGDPTIVNTTDSNAAAGHPSIGLGQTIQSTFNAYALPGHNDIRNPVDNIIAFTRYANARYGSLSNVPGVKAVRSGGKYTGY
jgi:hypothetical protein